MGLYPRNINEYVASLGIPRGPLSQAYVVDPANGSDGASGKNWNRPLKTVAAALAKCVAGRHDAILQISGPTADSPATPIAFNKDFTHWLGLSSGLPGMGQRARVTGSAANDLAQVVTFSAQGCEIRNLQLFNSGDADADAGAAIISGSRNHFKSVFFAGMGHATPAARAGSFSLKLSGAENFFEDCVIGLTTIVRAAANGELILASGANRNTFKGCRIESASETAGKFMVIAQNGIDRYQIFEDCIFYNFSANWAVSLTNAFKMEAAATHDIILKGNNMLVGITGWADTVTRLKSAEPVPNAGFGVAIAPTT